MKAWQTLIFYLVVLAVYVPLHYYLFHRLSQSLPPLSGLRFIVKTTFLFLASSYLGGRLLERLWSSPISDVMIWIGSFWLAIFVYGLIIILLIDLVRVADYLVPFIPTRWLSNPAMFRALLLGASTIVILFLIVIGYSNALSPRTKHLDLHIGKAAGNLQHLNIVLVTDLHLGHIIGKWRTKNIVGQINDLSPDIILLAGDVIDEDIRPVLRKDLGSHLNNLSSKYGVYAIPGNHEYIGGIEAAIHYLTEHNISVLSDSVVLIDDAFYLIGRKDLTVQRFTGTSRKEISSLILEADISKPVILLDHQPFHLEKANESGVDLQLSGHTHGGQMWPFTYIIQAMYEIGSGYGTRGDTQYYVSSGVGTWGPPVRIGTRPEIVNIRLMFSE